MRYQTALHSAALHRKVSGLLQVKRVQCNSGTDGKRVGETGPQVPRKITRAVRIVIVHPEIPPHYWDGETMRRIEGQTMSDDDKLLNDIIEAVTRLGQAFNRNDLDAPISIGVPERTHDRLKMLRPSHMIYDARLQKMTMRICGVQFKPEPPHDQ